MVTEARLMDAEALAEYLSVSKSTVRSFGEKVGAIVRIGRRCVYDRRKIDAAIDELSTEKGPQVKGTKTQGPRTGETL